MMITFYCVEIRSVKIDDSRYLQPYSDASLGQPFTRAVCPVGREGSHPLRKRDEQAIQFFQPLLDELQKAGWRKKRG